MLELRRSHHSSELADGDKRARSRTEQEETRDPERDEGCGGSSEAHGPERCQRVDALNETDRSFPK